MLADPKSASLVENFADAERTRDFATMAGDFAALHAKQLKALTKVHTWHELASAAIDSLRMPDCLEEYIFHNDSPAAVASPREQA